MLRQVGLKLNILLDTGPPGLSAVTPGVNCNTYFFLIFG